MVDPNDRRAFCTIVAAACVDGDLSEHERQVIHRKATEYDIPIGLVREIIDLGVQGKLAVAVPPGQAERETLLDDLIDVACADGRIEAPEHHLLAKFASHLGLALPDLRARVRQRLQEKPAAPTPKRATVVDRRPPPPPPPAVPAPRPSAPREKKPEPERTVAPPTPPVTEVPTYVPGPVTLTPGALLQDGKVGDLPPVTLHLIKQSVMFETRTDALHYIERTLTVTKQEAEKLLQQILEAFPDLKPGSENFRGRR